ncbi:hypothetical protein D3C80_1737810 [compost metagenome]
MVGSGQMPVNGAQVTFTGIDQHWYVTGQQTLLAVGDEQGQAGFPHLLMQALKVVFLVRFAVVHGRILVDWLHRRQAIGSG